MEKETELYVSRKSRENGGAQPKPLQPPPQSKVSFEILRADVADDDDDAYDCISLKEWQPSETKASSMDSTGASHSACKPVKEKDGSSQSSVRSHPISGYKPLVQTNGDVCLPPSVHGDAHPKLPSAEIDEAADQQDDDLDNGIYEDGLEDDLEDELEVDSNNRATESENVDTRPKSPHHQHSISLVNGIAPPPAHPTGGIAFDITLDDHESSQSRRSTGSSRGSSLRVSFINDVMLDSPSPPRHTSKSPYRSRPNQIKSPAKSKPSWESSTKIGTPAPPMPKKFVRPTLHGIKVKKGEGGVAKTAMRASASSIETDNGFKAREGLPKEAVGRSWDPHYCGGGEYDSVSQLISKSLISSTDDYKKEHSNGTGPKPVRPSLPRSNGVHKHDDHDLQNGGEGLKPTLSGGGGITEANKLTGDFGKLFSKLRRASAPLSKPPTKQKPVEHPGLKPSSASLVTKISRANSTPVENPKSSVKKSLVPLHSLDSSGANQKFAIGSYASLKLLQECAQTEKSAIIIPAYNVHKPRKIRDHEPHRHFYKTISKTLDSKLKA